ncbi:MAG: Rho termination factor N-terminal domain-containing protein, partial [Jatrophihabitantaceae bacterium]
MTDTQDQLIVLPGTESADASANNASQERAKRRSGSLSSMLLPELQALAGSMGIAAGKMRKSDLIAAIETAKRPQGNSTSAPAARQSDAETTPAAQAPPTTRTRRSATRAATNTQPTVSEQAVDSPPAAASPTGDGALDTARGSDSNGSDNGSTRQAERGRSRETSRNRDGQTREASSRDSQTRDAQTREANGRDGQTRESQTRDAQTREANGRDGQTREANGRDAQTREANGRDAQTREANGRDAQTREANGRDGQARDGGRDGNREFNGRDGSRNQNQNRNQTGPSSNNDDDDEFGSGRRPRRYRDRRGRTRDRAEAPSNGGRNDIEPTISDDDVLVPVAGIIDNVDDKGSWFIRVSGYFASSDDVYVANSHVRRYNLRRGDAVTGAVRQAREGERKEKFNPLVRLDTINGVDPEQARNRVEFTKLTPLYPQERLRLETEPHILTTRVIDLVMPIGKGQRALIVSPPKAGKTMIMQAIA